MKINPGGSMANAAILAEAGAIMFAMFTILLEESAVSTNITMINL